MLREGPSCRENGLERDGVDWEKARAKLSCCP